MVIFPHDGVAAFWLLSVIILKTFLGFKIWCYFQLNLKLQDLYTFLFFPVHFYNVQTFVKKYSFTFLLKKIIKCQPELHVYLKYFSRLMTTTLRVLLGFLLCCSCTQDVSVVPQSHLPYLFFCIRSYMYCYNYVSCNTQNNSIHYIKSTAYTSKPKNCCITEMQSS